VTLDRGVVEELRVGPHRRNGCEFVDCDPGRRRVAKYRHQSDGGIVAARLIDSWLAARGNKVKAGRTIQGLLD
jgi:hypothetical protein